MATLIKIPSETFRKLDIPGEKVSGKMYVAIVNIKDVPHALEEWRTVNPREVNLSSGVSKQIRKTLDEKPQEFIFRNRGITVIASRVEYDNRVNEIRVEFEDKSSNGVLDGGHTLMNILQYIENTQDPAEAYVRIEFLEGIKNIDDAVDIVDARNRSTAVKVAAFENLLGHFDPLKAALSKQPYAEKIAYKENELSEDETRKEVPIEEILAYVLCFDAEDFDHNNHPVIAYSGKATVVKYYEKNVEQMKKYFALAPEILQLKDAIYVDIPQIWNENGNNGEGGRMGRVRGVKMVTEKTLPFSGKKTRHSLPSGFIFPALAAFRALVKVVDGKAQWRDDPMRVYESLKTDLVKRVVESAIRDGNPNDTGKNVDLWGVCYSMVEREVLVRKL
jgi:hypothetical protein